MIGRKKRPTAPDGTVDGGEGRGVPLGGHDERPPTGYRSETDDEFEVTGEEHNDSLMFFLWLGINGLFGIIFFIAYLKQK